jgi:heat shock protein HslJ
MPRIATIGLVLLCASCASPIAEPPALQTAGETEWVLRWWDSEDPAPGEPPITLTYKDGRFAGRSGCNSYSGAVAEGEQPGDIAISPIISTRMACADPVMQAESRYLKNLQGATKISIAAGDLTIAYQDEAGASGAMRFAPRSDPQP